MQRFGGLDVLFSNAGIDGDMAPVETLSVKNFDHVIGVNLRGVFLGIKYALPIMRAQKSGSIINTSSAAGIIGIPMAAIYSASKGGVIQLTKAAAVECAADGVRINAICPGMIETPLTAGIHPEMIEATIQAHAASRAGRRNRPRRNVSGHRGLVLRHWERSVRRRWPDVVVSMICPSPSPPIGDGDVAVVRHTALVDATARPVRRRPSWRRATAGRVSMRPLEDRCQPVGITRVRRCPLG